MNDFQSLVTCIQLLVEINLLERGKKTEFRWAGRAWSIKPRRSGVQIGHQTNRKGEDKEGRFSLAEFKAALQGWLQFLEKPRKRGNPVEVHLSETREERESAGSGNAARDGAQYVNISTHLAYDEEAVPGGVPIKMWTRGVPVEDEARRQLANAARLPFVFKHIAAMPDVHLGIGATVGSVIPTLKAIIPARWAWTSAAG